MRKNTRTTEYRRMMALLNLSGFSCDADRKALATKILDRDVESFTTLEPEEIETITSHLLCWETVQEHRFYNGTLAIESELYGSVFWNAELRDYDGENGSRILADAKERREFMKKHKREKAVKEHRKKMKKVDKEEFKDLLREIESKRGVERKELTYYGGRWPQDQVIYPFTASMGLAIGIGGVPRGRIIHLWGQKHGGKSMIAYHIAAEAQKQQIPVILIDAEAAATGDFANHLGVDESNIAVFRPNDLEELCTLLRDLKSSGALIIVDSIASSVSSAELERNLAKDSPRVGGNAKLWADTFASMRAAITESGTTLVLINQVRSKIGASQWEDPEKPYGSEAIQHQSDIMIKVTPRKEKNATLKTNGYQISELRFGKNRFSGLTPTLKLCFKPGTPYNKAIDLVRICDYPISEGSATTYAELSDNAIVPSSAPDPSNPKELLKKKNQWAIKIDPYMVAAIRADEPDFDDVDIEPAEDFVPRPESWEEWEECDGEWSVPPFSDDLDYEYFKLPRTGELQAAAWLKLHPQATAVIESRLLDGLNKRHEIMKSEQDI